MNLEDFDNLIKRRKGYPKRRLRFGSPPRIVNAMPQYVGKVDPPTHVQSPWTNDVRPWQTGSKPLEFIEDVLQKTGGAKLHYQSEVINHRDHLKNWDAWFSDPKNKIKDLKTKTDTHPGAGKYALEYDKVHKRVKSEAQLRSDQIDGANAFKKGSLLKIHHHTRDAHPDKDSHIKTGELVKGAYSKLEIISN